MRALSAVSGAAEQNIVLTFFINKYIREMNDMKTYFLNENAELILRLRAAEDEIAYLRQKHADITPHILMPTVSDESMYSYADVLGRGDDYS